MALPIIVYDTVISQFLNNRILDPGYAARFPGALFVSHLRDLVVQRGWRMMTADVFLETRPVLSSRALPLGGLDLSDTHMVLAQLGLATTNIARAVPPGGITAAKERLQTFLDTQLDRYADQRSDPSEDLGSGMSPYLHFGQISPLFIALRVHAAKQVDQEARDAYLEELIVRRELAMNFVHYNPFYDSYEALPEWSRKTLSEHRCDPRPYVYDRDQLERAAAHDPYWNG